MGDEGARDDLARWVEGLVEGRRGTLMQQKRERQVFAIPATPPATHWAKRGWGAKRAELRREADNARVLEAMGLGPAVVASGSFRSAEWLVVEDAGHSLYAVRGSPALHVLALVATSIRRLHGARLSFPDLSAGHTFLADGRVQFIDVARLRHHRTLPDAAHRAQDLAALLFSLGTTRLGGSRTDRVRLIRDATGTRGEALRDMLRRVDLRLVHLAERTRWRHGFSMDNDLFYVTFAQVRGEDLDWDALPLTDPLDDSGGMTLVRTLPDRKNLTLGRLPGGAPRFFVKIFPPTKSGWSPAMLELAAIDRFQRAGILVNRVAAYAEDVDKGSMVAVKACDGEPLDDLLRRGVTVAERRALAVQTARIWRRMRECGLRHRDAYPCHVFASLQRGGAELRLIDMTRAGLAPWPKERWFVKDAAALWHGCPKPPVTRTDAVRWLREYWRIPKLTREAKRFARKVAAKEATIAARQVRKAAKKARPTGRA